MSDACPGPIATQIGQGILWALPLMAGVLTGVHLFLRRHATETEPATDPDDTRATAAAALPAGSLYCAATGEIRRLT